MMRILIVDDDTNVLLALGRFLDLKGAETIAATGLNGALAVLKATPANEPFFAIVTDNDMEAPGDGVRLLAEVRRRHLKIPVILMSGGITEEEREDLRRKGFAEVFCKPASAKDIVAALQKLAAQ